MDSGPLGLIGDPAPRLVTLVDDTGSDHVEILHQHLEVEFVLDEIVILPFAMIYLLAIPTKERIYQSCQQHR